jgi:cob(I)alamin adenosyltransferase
MLVEDPESHPGARYFTDAVKIYTRKGDDGTTSLWYGGRVSKTDARTEAYGSLDEAASALGVARALADNERLHADILHLQDDLFVAGAELATAPEARGRLETGVSRLDAGMVDWLEDAIDGYMAAVNLPPKFVIPGGTQLSAQLDVARSVLRRAERRIVALAQLDDLGDSPVLKYVNRASDLLFAMARFADVPDPELFEGRGRSSAEAT